VAPAPATPRSRPLSTSTEETRVEDVPASSPPRDDVPRDHLGFPVTPKKGRGIPEDDGMRELRTRIHAINAQDIPSADKARRIHDMLLEGYRASQNGIRSVVIPPSSPGKEPALHAYEPSGSTGPLESLKFWNGQLGDTPSEKFNLTESDRNGEREDTAGHAPGPNPSERTSANRAPGMAMSPGALHDLLLKGYLKSALGDVPPLQARRTLDQYFYTHLGSTAKRDVDQVVLRYTSKYAGVEPKIFMVDQLWLWLLDDGE